jgi:hypothetical protein
MLQIYTARISCRDPDRLDVTRCYCVDPERCHRTVLAGLLVKAGEHMGLPAEYLGEVARAT